MEMSRAYHSILTVSVLIGDEQMNRAYHSILTVSVFNEDESGLPQYSDCVSVQ